MDPAIPEYFYARVGLMAISFDANDAGQVDEVLQFRIGIREQGSILDRIVFADASNPGPVDQTGAGLYAPLFQLDALTNSPVEFDGDPSDVNGDGDVDGADFLEIQRTDPSAIAAWEAAYPGALSGISSVPEPSSCLLLLAGSMMAALGRRR